jgi:hypothetical protein
MLPIENYKMVIFENNKLVRLERIDGIFKNSPPLLANYIKGKYTPYPIILHKPKGSDSFKIIRK